jgi:L-threonylcarbamoyladenylate synthase
MKVIKTEEKPLGDILREAVETLNGGGVVAYPTETFYALGVKIDIEDALERVFQLKGRPRFKAISLIVGGDEEATMLIRPGAFSPAGASGELTLAQKLVKRYWPGPLTLVFPAREGLSELLTYGGTVAVRVPGGSLALNLARAVGCPITATSANPAGMPPPREASSVKVYFRQGVDLLIDDGPTKGGLPSTIADVTGGRVRIIREGVIRLGEEWEDA